MDRDENVDRPLLHDEIPIAVVWDQDLTDKDKLVFGEIFTMINQGKPFIMSNRQLAARLNCNTRTISRCISDLIHTNWIKTKPVESKNGALTLREVYGINLQRCMQFSSMTHRHICLGLHDKNVHQIDHSNKSNNTSVSNKKKVVDDLQKLCVVINDFVMQEIDDWFNTYNFDLILKAIHMVGTRNPSPKYVVNDISQLLRSGCKVNQPKQHRSYKPIAKTTEKMPEWSKENEQSVKKTDPALKARIEKRLRKLGEKK